MRDCHDGPRPAFGETGRASERHEGVRISGFRVVSISLALLAGVCLLCAAFAPAFAQEPTLDSKGREFWVTFIENFGSGFLETSDMRLYVSADSATTVTVRYNGNGQTETIAIPTPRRTFEIDISTLFGPAIELAPVDRGVSRKSFHIEAEHDITVYGVNVREYSSDAFMGLPDDALTRRYVLLSYPNGYDRSTDSYDQPSEFAVIGTEDGTEVTITPKALLNGRATQDPFVVGLNEGDVFFAQSALGLPQDVTGTVVRSTKPIAVFSGNRRTSIPTSVGNQRDHLVEQMPPVDAWGTSAIIAPHVRIQASERYPAVARIVAADNNTTWEINGMPQTPLQAGDAVEFEFTNDPLYVTASGPVLVAQYEHSVFVPPFGSVDFGDPFMMVIPPPEQFDTSYAFQSITHELLFRHFVNVVVPTIAQTSLRLDGVPIVASYNQIPGTKYSYAQIEVEGGSHYMTCDSAFGLYAYGYGYANSYGYPGGTLFRTLTIDSQHPFISVNRECSILNGVAIDNRSTDLGIDSCYIIDAESQNAVGTIMPFTSPSDSVFYSATVVDPYRDGLITVKAIDSAGRSVTQRSKIAGYTIGASATQGSAAISVDVVSYNENRACGDIELVNYGEFEHRVDGILVSPASPQYSITTGAGFVMAPGERRTLEFCYDGTIDSLVTVTLIIGDTCIDRNVVELTLYAITDTLPPSVALSGGHCDDVDISILEPDVPYHGVASVDFVRLINATPTFKPDTAALPTSIIDLKLQRQDPYEDMIYEVEVTDMAGNSTTYADTVGGYTVGAYDPIEGERISDRLGVEWQTRDVDFLERRCDSLLLRNCGLRELVIGSAQLEHNREFSVPPSQFPIRIAPGDSVYLQVCLEGRFAGDQLDTLMIVDECGRLDRVPMKSPVGFGFGEGTDRCGQSLTVQAFAPAKQTFLTAPFPNPSPGGAVGLDIGLSRDEWVTLEILDMNGESRLRVLERVEMEGGVHRLHFDPTSLESGTYFCRMTTADGTGYSSRLVLSR